MPNFDINSRFNKEANFSQVLFGEDGYVLETELNEMQHIQEEARAQIVRESIPSGVLNYFEPTFLPTTPNTFRLGQEMKVNVNGHIITIPKDTDIVLNEPPTEDFQSVTGKVGYREDLVFLEVWKEEVDYTETIPKFGGEGQPTVPNTIKDGRVGVETTRRIQTKWRIRVVDDVDFDTYTADGFRKDTEYMQVVEYNTKVTSQGANSEPLTAVLNNNYIARYCYVNNITRTGRYDHIASKSGINDAGLYISGQGDDTSKELLKTVDGYSYAIPLFRVKRRNSGEYSVNNGNGARKQVPQPIVAKNDPVSNNIPSSSTKVIELTQPLALYLKVGDILTGSYTGNKSKSFEVISIKSDTSIEVKNISDNGLSPNYMSMHIVSVRPDNVFSNIIDQRDIIDLRHKVSLTGFNYQELLEENFDKLLRGELNTKEGKKLLKTYHGIRKTPIDSNTVFYASFDGTTVAEVGGSPDENYNKFDTSFTGSGIELKEYEKLSYDLELNSDAITMDVCLKSSQLINSNPNASAYILELHSGEETVLAILKNGSKNLRITAHYSYIGGDRIDKIFPMPDISKCSLSHIRLTYSNGLVKCYINGKLIVTINATLNLRLIKNLRLSNDVAGWGYNGNYSDLSISSIDRGDSFATLPKDLIDGYATIAPAFNEQRNIFGDPLTSQVTTDVIKASGSNDRHIEITQATKGVWANGDTIKVRGLCSEIITGLIDTDTALTTITKEVKNPVAILYCKDVSKLSVGDKIVVCDPSTKHTTSENTITNIDSDNSFITLSSQLTSQPGGGGAWDVKEGYIIIESTTSSSSPLTKFIKDSKLTNVVGTWTGLGTSEVTFTLGENTGLTNQDIQIDYSLNMIAGQGGISEVLTETLGGEYNGKKLVKGQFIKIVDDFTGKVQGSLVECPHISKWINRAGNIDINAISMELGSGGTDYKKIYSKNSDSIVISTQTNSEIPQQLFSFNIIRIVEDKFGKIPSLDKVKWLRDNVRGVSVSVSGYGINPTGNKLFLKMSHKGKTDFIAYITNESSSIANCEVSAWSHNGYVNPTNAITDDGFVNAIIYTEASDGATPSKIFIDYANVNVYLKSEDGFDVLTPENPRRDAGLSGALLVRKETKEIRRYPLGKADENTGIVTYGDYSPSQIVSEYYNEYNLSRYINKILAKGRQAIVTTRIGSYHAPSVYDIEIPKYYYNMFHHVVPRRLWDYLSKTHSMHDMSKYMSLTDTKDVDGYIKYSPIGEFGFTKDFLGVPENVIITLSKEVPVDCLGLYALLGVINGSLKLIVIAENTGRPYYEYRHTNCVTIGEYYCKYIVDITGKPLIKE